MHETVSFKNKAHSGGAGRRCPAAKINWLQGIWPTDEGTLTICRSEFLRRATSQTTSPRG
jgi:hypothetical protein